MNEIRSKHGRKLGDLIPTGAFVVGILALVVSIIFGLRTDRRKMLEVQYLSRLSLIASQGIENDSIRVRFGNEEIKNLTKQLIRIRNSGELPIEKRDVEVPITFRFGEGVRVLNANVERTSPTRMDVGIEQVGSDVLVHHGLLNDGDWIEIQLLLDGPGEWPSSTCRISAIKAPTEVFPSEMDAKTANTIVPLPAHIENAVVVLALIGSMAFGWAGLVASVGAIRMMLPARIRQLVTEAVTRMQGSTDVERRDHLAQRVYYSFPYGADSRAQSAIERIELQVFSMSKDEIVDRVVREVEPTTMRGRFQLVLYELLPAILLFACTSCILLVVGAALRRMAS